MQAFFVFPENHSAAMLSLKLKVGQVVQESENPGRKYSNITERISVKSVCKICMFLEQYSFFFKTGISL